MPDYENTRFEIDEYAGQALDAHASESADDADVVHAIAMHVWDGFSDSSNDQQEDFADLRGYFDAADGWCDTIAEFDEQETKEFFMIGRRLFTESLLDRADDLDELCAALNMISSDLEPGETFAARLNAANYTAVPSFGDNVPGSDVGRVSFDYDQLIVEAADGTYKIIDRQDVEKAA
ncbi:MAG: hypothetical protein Q7T73_02675 [Beijerinckiaceae bacterium]|nr:hypothetical protein [Beijerinckiaceae bacterium]